MVVGRGDMKSLVGALVWINNEVRKGFVEGLNGVVNILLDDKE